MLKTRQPKRDKTISLIIDHIVRLVNSPDKYMHRNHISILFQLNCCEIQLPLRSDLYIMSIKQTLLIICLQLAAQKLLDASFVAAGTRWYSRAELKTKPLYD